MRALRLSQFRALRLIFGEYRWWGRVTALAEGWRVMRLHPEVMHDLAMLGHIHEPDINPATGQLYPHDELVARAARRSLVLMLFARAEITETELTLIRMESDNDTDQETVDGHR